jgi:hypothetical protein
MFHHCPGEVMPEYMLTKPLDGTKLKKLIELVNPVILEQTCYVLKFHDFFPHIEESLYTYKFVSLVFSGVNKPGIFLRTYLV